MQIPLLTDLLIIFSLSIGVLFACHRFRIPTVVGLLLTGILAGPHGLGFIKAVHEVEVLAEIGVVLLLFTIGLEFSLQNLREIKRTIVIGGGLQVTFTVVCTLAILVPFTIPMSQALFIGFMVSLSSTAIVLKILQERAEVDSAQGRVSFAVLIFQDLAVVPMLLSVPLLAGVGKTLPSAQLLILIKGFGVLLLVVVGAKSVVPALLYQVARTRSRELFLLSVLGVCLGVA